MTSIKVPWGALLVGIVGVRLLLPWLPMEWLIANTLSDDAFYYFQVARNAAAGRGVTFDGEHPTNGFHPLWMGMSIAVYALTPNQPTLPIHTLLFVSTLFDLAAAFLIFLTVSRFSGNRLLCWGAPLLYPLNPYLIRHRSPVLQLHSRSSSFYCSSPYSCTSRRAPQARAPADG